MTMRTLVLTVLMLMMTACKEDPCKPTVTVISATWSGAGHGSCDHSKHVFSTKDLGGGALQINCECPDPKNGKK